MRHGTLALTSLTLLWLDGSLLGAGQPSMPDFRPDPLSVQRYGPAYRYPQAGWIVLHVEGQPYERGYQHGRLLANEIVGYLKAFATTQSPKAPSDAWKHTRTLTNALFLRRFDKEYLEEMKGIADGASAAGARWDGRPIDVVDIATINSWAEIETLPYALDATPTGLEGMRFPHAQPKAMPEAQPHHCSAFAATGPATADGKIVFGHITMFGLLPAHHFNVYLDIKPAKGHRVLMCTYPGSIQSGMDYYINDAGLLIAETTISQTRFDIKGHSVASRIRQAIQYAKTIDQAVEILKKDNNGLYTNEWLLGDINTNEIAVFQLGTHKSRLSRSSKNEWFGGTDGFYWGCNNTKDLDLRLETIASVQGRPENVVFRPSDRDMMWQRLYHKHKGKIGVAFGKEAFTTPPVAGSPSLDAKFTTTDLAMQLKSWALFGPPLGRAWQPTEEQRKLYPDIKPLVSNPWTVLHANAPPKAPADAVVAVDLPDENGKSKVIAASDKEQPLVNVPAWHGTLLPASDADVWLATAFADYQTIYAREKALRGDKKELSPEDRDRLALDLFAHRSAYLTAARADKDVPLSKIRSELARDQWYRMASGKGVLLLHELRHMLGDRSFADATDSFGRANAGKKVTTAQFQQHMETATGKSLGAFFKYWHTHSGLPTLRLDQIRVDLFAGAARFAGKVSPHVVRGSIHRASGLPDQRVDVTVETRNSEVTRTVVLKGAETPFSIEVSNGAPAPSPQPATSGGKEPEPDALLRVVVDKYGKLARANGGAFSVMSFFEELERCLIVYGTGDEPASNREAAEVLQKTIRERWSNYTVPIKPDREATEAELKSNHILLIGRPDSNAVIERVRKDLPITFGSRSFVVRNQTYAHPGSAVIVAADNPHNGRYSLVVLAGLSADSTWHTPAALFRGDGRAEVLLLPHQSPPQALVLPARELVHTLAEK